LQGANEASKTMIEELSSLSQRASLGGQGSRLTARDALSDFVSTAELLDGEPNSTRALSALNQLSSLHKTLHRAAGVVASLSKSELMARTLAREAQEMLHQARRQREVLGVYRAQSQAARKAVSAWRESSHMPQALLALDGVWWRLRDQLDEYLDLAEEEVGSIQTAFEGMADYERCRAGTSQMAAQYSTSMATMERSHRQLRRTWRAASNLLGELASIITDGRIFQTFVQDEGCKSSSLLQTTMQVKFAFRSMRLLSHRFKLSALAQPDHSGLRDAAMRVRQAFLESTKSCK